MSALSRPVQSLVYRSLLRAASVLVPATQRAEWLREWRGELWHVRQACATDGPFNWQSEWQILAFCLGAFPDALCLRRAARPQLSASAPLNGTARQCLLILGALAAAGYGLALLLPGVSAERSLWQRQVNPNLVLIEQAGSDTAQHPTIPASQFRSWERRNQQFFDGLAFYRVEREPLEPGLRPTGAESGINSWSVAHASPNLFHLLGLPVRLADPDRAGRVAPAGDVPEVILSERVWKRQFGADSHVAGVTIRLGSRPLRIAGVAADGSLALPGGVDVWLLDPEVARTPGFGYVIAHLTALGKEEMWTTCVHISASAPNETDADQDLLAIALDARKRGPQALFLFAAFLALLALPAITTVSLGQASINPHPTSWLRRLHRSSFFAAKIALLLPAIYFISLDLAYGCTLIDAEQSAYLQLLSTFGACLFGLRWVLKDQRQRCPVCMRTVTHPAQVGVASRTFLDWNGTEMMCMGGHTLLHVPSLPTSWFSSQRWLYLDTSWTFLFAASTPPTP